MAVGGTFDELHRGHKTLLQKAFETGERVVIGLCSDEFVDRMKKPHVVAPYEQRLEDLRIFLLIHGWLERARIVPINSPYGDTLSKEAAEAIVVSIETEPTAIRINEKRREIHLRPLKIVTIAMVPSENDVPISTTRIRFGEIDRQGHVLRKKRNT